MEGCVGGGGEDAWVVKGVNWQLTIGHYRVPPGPLYENEVKYSAFDMDYLHSRANKIHFQKKGCALGLVLKVRVFGTSKLPDNGQNFD